MKYLFSPSRNRLDVFVGMASGMVYVGHGLWWALAAVAIGGLISAFGQVAWEQRS